MTITGALVLYAVFWVMGMLIALPLGLQTHGDAGSTDEITPASSPTNPRLKAKAIWVTIVATALWAVICGVIMSGWITIESLDFWGRM